jgi:hypothetical protein
VPRRHRSYEIFTNVGNCSGRSAELTERPSIDSRVPRRMSGPQSLRSPVSRPQLRASDWTVASAVPILVGLGVYCVAVAGARSLLNDGDTLSHIAIGRWIIAHRAIPFDDPFTYTARGRAWVPHEWLAEILFAVAYDRLGWGGVVAATGLCGATAFALLTQALVPALGLRRAVIGALAAFALTEAHFLARPHVLAWPLLVVWMMGVIGARDADRVPPLALLPVMILWCNLHGGFVIGLSFAGLLAAEAVLQAPGANRLAVLRGWGAFLALSTLAALVSPNGVHALLLPLKMLRMPFALASISEWHSADFARPGPLEFWIGLVLLAGFRLGIKLPLSRISMVLLLLWAALAHVRNEELLGMLSPLLVAAPIAAELGPAAPLAAQLGLVVPARGTPGRHRRAGAAARMGVVGSLEVAVVLTFFATAWALDRHGLAPRGEVAPVAALAAAHRAGLDGPVFNSLRFGGYLLFEGLPTFVDGRADLFGDVFIERYAKALSSSGDQLPRLLDRYDVGWTLLEPSSPAGGRLDRLAGWERVYADRFAVIHRRKGPLATATPARCSLLPLNDPQAASQIRKTYR